MSVLIKGMEMPKSCEKCPCKTADAFGGLGCQATGYIPLRKVNQDRPNNCPLVEVPTPHGRLIDADKLKIDWLLAEERQGPDKIFQLPLKEYISNGCVYDLDNAPTIIEAEVTP